MYDLKLAVRAFFVLFRRNEKRPFIYLRYYTLKIGFFNRVIPDMSVVLRETTLTFSDSTKRGSSVEAEMERVVSLSGTEKTEITRLTLSQTSPGFYVSAVQVC